MEQPPPDEPQPAVPDRLRRRLDEVFGDVLPDLTRDEVAGPDDRSGARDDDWLRANRPPHHDDRD